jgi:hypothetical protein
VLAAALIVGSACGKKGPPLAPIVRIPAAVEAIEAQRVGNDVYVTLTIPAQNVDEYTPADLQRVEVYGYTGTAAPPRGRFADFAERIAVVPVAPPPAPEDGARAEAGDASGIEAPAQGASITVLDRLTADDVVQKIDEPGTVDREPGTELRTGNTNREPRTANQELRRYYTAYAFSPRSRPSPPGAVAEFPILPVPDAPPAVSATYDDRAVTLTWEPAGGLLGFLFERTLPDEPPPPTADLADEVAAPPAGPLAYNVYRTTRPEPLAPPEAAPDAWNAEPPSPLNPAPLSRATFADPVEFGVERCYTVRGVRGAGADARVGLESPPACVTPVDTFPPAPPRSLAAVATEGAISLIWQPNAEKDLGGYVVLRAEAPGDTLQPLTPVPLTDARYRDDAVMPGVRYVYAVVAVDARFPVPNVSAASNRVEEIAR